MRRKVEGEKPGTSRCRCDRRVDQGQGDSRLRELLQVVLYRVRLVAVLRFSRARTFGIVSMIPVFVSPLHVQVSVLCMLVGEGVVVQSEM